MDRRTFLAAGSIAATAPLAGWPALSSTATGATAAANSAHPHPPVNFWSDGLGLGPVDYAAQLQEAARTGAWSPDSYSNGGLVADIERAFAQRLGKPAAVYLPSGTLANHLAVRTLAGAGRRVLVQAESHLYNDSGDGAATLSGLNLVPLAKGRATLSVEDVAPWVERSSGGRVPNEVGVISVESPVRRLDHAMADLEQTGRLSRFARERGIRLHLDGSRMFNLPLHTGRSVADVAAMFDTVYVSLWKHFNGTAGAVLAGDEATIAGLSHVRRMFGASLPQAWPTLALVPLHLPRYEDDYARAWGAADRLIALLEASGRFSARKVENGTSRFHLSAPGADLDALAGRAAQHGVLLPGGPPDATAFAMQVNPSLLHRPPEAISQALLASLDA
ncbi:threonine aldolase family protein [Lysobacter sp. A3-1-A15]|uniref:threonine aldolase family protein n=1 Tax=Novilysobacter viscosus TaxID=3098602 RepID=UPI002EDBB4F1